MELDDGGGGGGILWILILLAEIEGWILYFIMYV